MTRGSRHKTKEDARPEENAKTDRAWVLDDSELGSTLRFLTKSKYLVN